MILEISNPLSLGNQSDDVARVHQALRALGRSLPIDETANRVLGPQTVAVVKALQAELGLTATGIVDAATVRSINARLAKLPADAREVRGIVRDANRNPVTSGFVLLHLQGPAGEKVLGKSPLDAATGAYRITYEPPPDSAGRLDLRLEVQDANGPVETTPSGASILIGAGPLEVVDFVLSGAKNPPPTEFEQTLRDLQPLLGQRDLAKDLEEDRERHDISLLAAQSGYPSEQIAALVLAHHWEHDTRIPAPVFYGLLRQGLPSTLDGLHAAEPRERLKALRASVEQRRVPQDIAGKKTEDYLADFVPATGPELRRLLGGMLDANEVEAFVGQYLKSSQDPATFWNQVASDPRWANRAEKLKRTAQVAVLTNNHGPLIDKIQSLPDMQHASDLTRLAQADWKALIQTQGVGIPEGTPGATPDEKANHYAELLVRQVEAAFPTRFFAERLGTSPVAAFLKEHPAFDLRATYPARFFSENPDAAHALTSRDRRELANYQRLYKLTESATETLALAARGIHSAGQITRLDRKLFAEQHQEAFSAERASAVYDRALRTHAQALALWGEHGTGLNRTGLHVLPKLNIQKQAAMAAGSILEIGPIPDWQALFGTIDFCACEECASAHGAAAYFVDVLRFLGERRANPQDPQSIRSALFARRPDLGEIELSCENTNTPLPLIDLVNEVLENAVVPPAPFVPFDLPPAFETDLSQSVTTGALADAFNPPLQPGARVDMLEPGARWRVRDDAFAYSVIKTDNVLRVAARSRQTGGSPGELRALPEYRNANAYVELAQSVYPWNLPFDLPHEEAKVFLAHLGVLRAELIEALRPTQEPFDPNSPAVILLAAERLGLTDMERKIIVGEPLMPPRQPEDFWGGMPVAALTTVQALLDRSGLRYAELEELLATGFVNPAASVTISAAADAPVDTCDPAKLQIDGLTDGVLDRLHRFVRLWRRLAWAVAEVDRAIRALMPAPDPPVITNEMLVRLDHLRALGTALRLPVRQTLALWSPIDTAGFDRQVILARGLGLTVPNLLAAIDLTGIDPFEATHSQDALRFAAAVKAIQTSGFSLSQLDYLVRHRFSPAASFVPAESSLVQSLAEARAGLLAVNEADAAEKPALQRSAVIDRLAAALDLSADVTGALLDRVTHGGVTAMQRFLALSAIAATPPESTPPPLTRDNAGPQLEILEHLLKIASVIRLLKLPGSQLNWLFHENPWLEKASDLPAESIPLASWFSLIQLPQLRKEPGLADGALEALLSVISGVATAVDPTEKVAAKQAFVDALSTWLGWASENIENLIGKSDGLGDQGLLNARFPEDYRVELIIRLHRAMRLLQQLGVGAAKASMWCDITVTDAEAKAIREAAKAKYDHDTWLKLSTPLQDSLREQQREALVGYLVARPETWTASSGQADANDLYAHFLIDVEMSACQLTSRIKQAIGSVQLFAQRCLMGLEIDIQTQDEKWEQWAWMKSFRVWEANRKIWLYPENWIEPDLRDDKTPFFTELENELLQTDLDNAAAERALLRYLEKLDQVARLEIVGVYEDDEDQGLHVFGRTFHTPHFYFYRRRTGATQAWTPWENVELDIEGNHLIPVRWNRKLLLIWPIFTEKQQDKSVKMPPAGGTIEAAGRYWEIQLAWSEYQQGRWSGKNLSQAVTFKIFQGGDLVLFGPFAIPQFTASRVMTTGGGPISDPPDEGGGPQGDLNEISPITNLLTGRPRLVPEDLFSFKALVSGDTLIVRGFLRRDYRDTPDAGDRQIACPFGEFRFFGCRKIVTTAHRSQMVGLSFPLAPSGTQFDRMGFTNTTAGLSLFDGQFPVTPPPGPLADTTIVSEINEPASIAGYPASSLVNKVNIPVLGRTPSPFRLLTPHQDLQFVGDRPFFFMDHRRAFIVSSTGSSGKISRPDLGSWVNADLAVAWRADYFPAPAPTAPGENPTLPQPAEDAPRSLTVLVSRPDGRRVARETVPVSHFMNPVFSPGTLIPTFWTTRQYRFANFHHPFLCDFIKTLARHGIAGLLSFDTQNRTDSHSFEAYHPEPAPRVLEAHPFDEVEFQSGRAYELYNWELFFHIPLLIADRLSRNQRFQEAQRWFHFIFDPTGVSGGEIPQRYWHTKPFHDRLNGDYETESVKTLEAMIANSAPEAWAKAVEVWRANPFNPHAVARLRTTAYQKAVVMKYIDNLIAWGDQLFRRETLESINEATQLYVLAAEILGRRPERIQRSLKPPVETFNSLEPKMGALGNALELFVAESENGISPVDSPQTPDLPSASMLYFCVPENGKLLGYWTTVADRLFKIRHCMNIEGQVRQLPLFEPPIDPALLVRAQAAGLSIGDVLSEIFAPLPHHRFSVMLQKANEMAAEVRNLGAALLSSLEKRDAEALSTLRSGQELRLLQAVRDIRVRQIDEAEANIAALQASQQMAQARKDYYESREKLNALEATSLLLLGASALPIEISAHLRVLAGLIQKFGSAKMGSPTTAGLEVGGYYIGVSVEEAAIALEAASNILNITSQATGKLADYGRRKDEWDHQANLSTIELKQLDKQLIAAQIRLAIAEQELHNHDQQVDNAREVDEFLRRKFTNQDLYQWMIGQVSGLYFQSYQLAYDLAKRAERCFRFELGLQDSSYVRFGYWDSLKKGLLAGEKLQYDLRRLEAAYLEQNHREFELTKHISLLLLDPLALVRLRETGRCFVNLPEEIFDLDYPGHYFRRIKSVSITLPCVAGPYTTISCTLRLMKNSIRINTADGNNGYPRNTDNPAEDTRFVENVIPASAIAASHAQNDSGVFELSFRDERYLPFEGAGVISQWSLELFSDNGNDADFGKPLRQFDYGTISDAILHVKYTAREDAGAFKNGAIAHLRDHFTRNDATPSLRLFNLRQEFPTQWHRFLNPANPENGNLFELEISTKVFRILDEDRTLKIQTILLLARCTDAGPYDAILSPLFPASPPVGSHMMTLIPNNEFGGLHYSEKDVTRLTMKILPTVPPGKWRLKMTGPGGRNLQVTEVEDLLLGVAYIWE